MAIASAVLALKDYIENTVIAPITFPAQITLFVAPIRTFRQAPKLTKLGSRTAVVLGNIEEDEHRVTPPRGNASKEVNYVIELLVYATAKNALNGGDQFDLLVETVKNAFRTANTGLLIADPLTTNTVWLHKIGENWKGRTLTPIQIGADPVGQADIAFSWAGKMDAKIWLLG
jgi:hypothetical protein